MARIRTIKPELWSSDDFCALSLVGSLTFLALIGHSDDEGRLKADARHIAKTMLHGVTEARRVQEQLDRMEERGMIERYTDGSAEYISLSNWGRHQRVEHPTRSRYPQPGQQALFTKIHEDSRTFHQERTGRERIGPEPQELPPEVLPRAPARARPRSNNTRGKPPRAAYVDERIRRLIAGEEGPK